jgi:hypothetical protein
MSEMTTSKTSKGTALKTDASSGIADGFVRYLGGFEHLHWLFSQSGPRAFALAMEVTGTTTVKQWRAALDALQLSQPFFSVLIDVDDDNRPYFRRVDGSPIPMRVLDGKFAVSWEGEMGKEVSRMIPADHAPPSSNSSHPRSGSFRLHHQSSSLDQ